MARMPGALWAGEQSPRLAMAAYDIVCYHTIVGFAPAHAAHFSVHSDGDIVQSRDTQYRSAANWDGNHRIIAIENEDHGEPFPDWGGSAVPPLTDAQVVSNAEILRWAHKQHDIPLKLCPDSRPGSRGLAWHRQGIDGNFDGYKYDGRVPGGELWSQHFGKVCPGDNRIDQRGDILRLARNQEVDVDDDDIEKIARRSAELAAEATVKRLLDTDLFPKKEDIELTVRQALKGWKPNPEE